MDEKLPITTGSGASPTDGGVTVTQPNEPADAPTTSSNAAAADFGPDAYTPKQVTRTIGLIALPVIALYGVMQGVAQILLPAQIQAIDPDNMETLVGATSLVGGLMGAIFVVVGPAISDRTRTRFGRRTPWFVIMALIVMAGLFGLATTSTVSILFVLCAIYGLATNWYSGCLYAVLPDRIPESRRGLTSSIFGLGLPLGILIFVNLVSRTSSFTGYMIVGIALIAATAIFVLGAPERSSLDMPRPERKQRGRISLRFFEAFRHWDFTMTFLSRFTFYLAYFAVTNFSMYILSEYIGLENIPGGNASTGTATLSSISTITQVIAVIICGPIADKFNRHKAIVGIAGFAMVAAFAMPLLMPSWIGMIAFNLIAGAAGGVYFSVDAALMSMVLPVKGQEGRDMGILNAASSVTAMFAALVGSTLIGLSGTYASLFVFGALLAAVCGICTFMIRNVR